jgi:ribosomal 50S subunit-associated protein YjgA (DUF615 family)
VLLLATPLLAQDLKVGDVAPPFRAEGAIVNPPEFARTLDDCKGDVVLIMEWHMRDGTARKLPEIQRVWDQYGGKGLVVFCIHRLDKEGLAEVRSFFKTNKYTFPGVIGGMHDNDNDFSKYRADSGFRTTIIDVDGKIAFYSKDDFVEELDKQLKRVVYPNLTKHKVAKQAEKAAKKLATRDFGGAWNEAKRLLGHKITDEAKADLNLLIERLKDISMKRLSRIEEYKAQRRWDLVVETLELLREEFRGHDVGTAARQELDRIRKEQKKEIEAFHELHKLVEKAWPQGDQILINSLEAFAKGRDGLGAAEFARAEVKRIKAEMDD